MRYFLFSLFLLFFGLALTLKAEEISRDKAVVRVLNRMKGITKTLTIPVSESDSFETLKITVKACYERPHAVGIQSNYWAFIQVVDTEKQGDSTLFSGWMPSIQRGESTLSDPTYDVWIKSCSQNESQ